MEEKVVTTKTESLLGKSPKARIERRGRLISLLAVGLLAVTVISIFVFISVKGLPLFFNEQVKLSQFFFGDTWSPGKTDANGFNLVGILPMLLGSLAVTLLALLIATPLSIGTALFITEISPRTGKKVLQPILELLVGIPSVVYGFVGLSVVVPFLRSLFGGSGFGILAGGLVLAMMILPTVASMTVDALNRVPKHLKHSSLALGANEFQTMYRVTLRVAKPGILTGVIFGVARAFGEALAVQMVIGNAIVIPEGFVSPATTLTSVLTQGMGNTIMGTFENDALWTLAFILLMMSLFFNLMIKRISGKGGN